MKKRKSLFENVSIVQEVKYDFSMPALNLFNFINFQKHNLSGLTESVFSKRTLFSIGLSLSFLLLSIFLNPFFIILFFVCVVTSSFFLWGDYEFYLIKKDFEENGLF